MPDVKRVVKLITQQRVIDKPSIQEGFPMRSWSIDICLLNENNEEVPADVFDRVVYNLHPSFDKRQKQTFKKPPFHIEEEGWGEFDMRIDLHFANRGGEASLTHDLNFQNERYESKHTITFKNPRAELLALLRESGPVGDENGVRGKREEGSKKQGKKALNIDMERLAEGLQQLQEDDLLRVVQMIHENKTAETFTRNDIEAGEFHVDLYTLPDHLVKMLWDFTMSKINST